jgi:hypothetical protein
MRLSNGVLSSCGVAVSSRGSRVDKFGNRFRKCARFNGFLDVYVEPGLQSADAVRFVGVQPSMPQRVVEGLLFAFHEQTCIHPRLAWRCQQAGHRTRFE